MIYFTYITIMDNQYALEAEYDYFPAERGARERGVPIEPDEPHFVEISGLKLDYSGDGEASYFKAVELPQSVTEQLEEQILEENH